MTSLLAGATGAIRCSLMVLVAFVVVGCAFSNVGMVDMRRTANEADANGNVPPVDAKNPSELELSLKNFSQGDAYRVKQGDSLAVNLRTAYVRDFFELGVNPLRRFQSNGEIAVVANAFEVETGTELDFVNMQSGRLVFFSNDVAQGQFLNFNNLPVYGPKTYTGQPFAMRVTIFELDGGSQKAKSLLNSIAKAGSTAYAPASPVLNLLNGIGQSLFDGERNDTHFRYTMQFNPKPGSKFVNSFTLDVGNYVLVRLEDRTAKVPWEKLWLDENKGMLYYKDCKCPSTSCKCPSTKCRCPFTGGTYLVFEINTGGSAKDIDLKQNTYDELLTELEKRDKEAAEKLVPLTTAIETSVGEILVRRTQTTNFDRAKASLETLKRGASTTSETREAAEFVIELLGKSLDANGELVTSDKAKGPLLTDPQVDYIVANLRAHVERRKGFSVTDYELLSRKSFGAKKTEILNLLVPAGSS